MVLTIVRSANWGLGTEEDIWQVEILGTATVCELKAKIEELYEVPQQLQRLSLGTAEADPALEDSSEVESLAGKRVHLHPVSFPDLLGGFGSPSPEAAAAISGMTQAIMGAAQEAQETEQALRESLCGVKYKVIVVRPQEAGGQAAGKRVTLELDALAQIQTVQNIVEVELFGAIGVEPAFLMFQDAPLPPHIALFHAGIDDGKLIVVSREPPPHPAEQLLGMLAAMGDQFAGQAVPPHMAGAVPSATA